MRTVVRTFFFVVFVAGVRLASVSIPFMAHANRVDYGGLNASDSVQYKQISRGEAAGEYQAFPDAYRLKNGDIVAVFYAGYGHISYPTPTYPKAGRLCMVRSSDDGHSWTKPMVIYDDEDDNRDPHISQLSDGTLIVSFFSLRFSPTNPKDWTGSHPQLIRSHDGGKSWDKTAQVIDTDGPWYCSSQVKQMADGALILPVYYSLGRGKDLKAWGGIVRSTDQGKTWGKVIPIGEESGLPLAAETDFVVLRDETLFAALRAQGDISMQYATSRDEGKTWSAVQPFGFVGHAPSFTRLQSGELLLAYRGFTDGKDFNTGYTALRTSNDEGKSWRGPYLIDQKRGAYPVTIERKDGSLLIIYYEEGRNSAVRAVRFQKPQDPQGATIEQPKPVQTLPL